MGYKTVLENLKNQPYFTKRDLFQVSEKYGLNRGSVDVSISRSLARKDIIQLKKGMYTSKAFYEENSLKGSYPYYLANVIKTPSYVSSWTALQYYDLATEAVHSIISVTPKVTRSYRTKIGTFAYHSIKKELFFGSILKKDTFDFFIASPAKALFDLIYFKTRQLRGVRYGEIDGLVEELRIDVAEMGKKDRMAFYALMKKYCLV